MKLFDSNKDGVLDRDEFATWYRGNDALVPGRLRSEFDAQLKKQLSHTLLARRQTPTAGGARRQTPTAGGARRQTLRRSRRRRPPM